MSAEEYLQGLEASVRSVDEQVVELQDEAFVDIDDTSTDEELLAASRVYYPQYSDVIEGFLDDMGALDPPPELEGVHTDYMEAGDAFAGVLSEAAEQVLAATTREDLVDAFVEADATAASERLTQACFDAQAIADEQAISVDLNC